MAACFPKDLDAFITIAKKNGYDFELLKAARDINDSQKKLLVKKIKDALWLLKDKQIGILGLSFKPNTDDLRSAPAIDIIRQLQAEGSKIKAFDPQSMDKAKDILPGVKLCKDVYETARNSDCLVITTEWNEFKKLDLVAIKKIMRQPIIVDGRNIYDPQEMLNSGFRYIAIGRTAEKGVK